MESEDCHFGKLSPELRNEVYSYLLPKDCTLPNVPRDPRDWTRQGEDIQPPLARVCRQIRSETIGILYGSNQIVLCLTPPSGKGRYFPWLLETAVTQAEDWLRRNPIRQMRLRVPIVVDAHILIDQVRRTTVLAYQCRWRSLANVLRETEYSEGNCLVEVHLHVQAGSSAGENLGERLREQEDLVEQTLREMGLMCEVHI